MNKAYEELERLAKEFVEETGLLAPWKIADVLVVTPKDYVTHRQKEFDKWLINRTGGKVTARIFAHKKGDKIETT